MMMHHLASFLIRSSLAAEKGYVQTGLKGFVVDKCRKIIESSYVMRGRDLPSSIAVVIASYCFSLPYMNVNSDDNLHSTYLSLSLSSANKSNEPFFSS
jgi:hypothetical protein